MLNPGRGGAQAGAQVDAFAESIAEHTTTTTQPQGDLALTRIIARRVPWPNLKERPDRAGLRLRWDALHEETGDLLVAGTEHPLADGAHALMMRGLSPEALVTMRHEGALHDSFVPAPLRIPAAVGAKRAEGRARMAALRAMPREETPAEGAVVVEVPASAIAALLSIRDAGAAA
jgi:hypothetical protein